MKGAPAAGRYGAECIGTFALVFMLGCAAHSDSVATAIAAGALITALIYGLCPVSGGHFNPAVTLSLRLADGSRISLGDAAGYIIAQVFGGIAGAYVYFQAVGQTLLLRPIGLYTDHQVAAVETIFTAALCYVFLNVACGTSNAHYGFAIGSTVTAAAIAAGPVSGCSLNPAVAAGSVLVRWHLKGAEAEDHLYLYLCSPLLGALLGLLAFFAAGGGDVIRCAGEDQEYSKMTPTQSLNAENIVRYGTPDSNRGALGRGSSGDLGDMAVSARSTLLRSSISPTRDAGSYGACGPEILRVVRHKPFKLPHDVIDHDLNFACRWRMRVARRGEPIITCDIDLSCAKLSSEGDDLGGVYFAKAEDAENGIRHSGDEIMGGSSKRAKDKDNESISFRLSKIKPKVFALVFFIGIFDEGQKFGDVDFKELCAKLVDSTPGQEREICRFEKKDFLSESNATVAAMLYRDGDDWFFYAVDESYALPPHSSYRMLLPEVQALVDKVQRPGSTSNPGSP